MKRDLLQLGMITIRNAGITDVKDLQTLNDEVFIDNSQYDDDLDMTWARSEKGNTYFTQLLSSKNTCCFIAEENGKKIGYIAAGPKLFGYRNSTYLEIENMGVIPQYRSKGIGTQLMHKCLQWAKTNRFQKIYVSTYFNNGKAIEFYKRSGFSAIDISLARTL